MMRIKRILILIVFVCMISADCIYAQQPMIMNASELKIALKKLQTLGNVLYIAPHPDDENTASLAYMAKEKMMRTGYLSLTRGDGGQNLVGSEKGELMGLIRTYELLAARRIDGAEQFFTRAVDFGFSKTSEESIAMWGKDNIVEDIVYVIRKFQPDIVITRFASTDGGSGHGHHTASAILALEAFRTAGDPSRFPQQLKHVQVWKPKRIFWNSWRPYRGDVKPEELQKLLSIDVGKYNPLLGKSYHEIASMSRSMHKSQGFGAVPVRGQRLDYYELIEGEPAVSDLFEGIDTSWNRIPGSQKVRHLLEQADAAFQFEKPSEILPLLFDALTAMEELPQSVWRDQKIIEIKEVIRSCNGLWLETMANVDTVVPQQEITVTAELINRSSYPITIQKIVIPDEDRAVEAGSLLQENMSFKQEFKMKVPKIDYTHPYWLKEKHPVGIYTVSDYSLRSLPIAPYPVNVIIVLKAHDREISYTSPILFRQRDPVEGEIIRSLTIVPPVTINFKESVIYFPEPAKRSVGLILRSGPNPVSGTLKLNLPASWKVQPAELPFTIESPLTEMEVSFNITPPSINNEPVDVSASAIVNDQIYNLSRVTINYPYLPQMILHPVAESRFVRLKLDTKHRNKHIGYIMGSGDDIPVYLAQVGYRVTLLDDEELRSGNLSAYGAIITGIRAYNTRDILKHVQSRLMDYVKNGGRMIVQYNTSRGLVIPQLGPYPFQISQNRVAEENAPVTILNPRHSLFQHPNRISAEDFNGWIQERGLYFADKWDDKYEAVMSCHDANEEPQKGGMLMANYGKGIYIYTGYSFFRQLPAGVPGALKLFVNLID